MCATERFQVRGRLRETKVCKLYVERVSRLNENIFWLDISVDDIFFMNGGQSIKALTKDSQAFLIWKGLLCVDLLNSRAEDIRGLVEATAFQLKQ